MSRRPKFDPASRNPQIDRLGSLAVKGNQVDPGLLQFCRKLSAGVGTGYGAGERRLGHHHVTSPGGRFGARQGTGGHDQNILGSQGITSRINFGEQPVNAEAPATNEVFGDARVQ